MHNKNNEYPAYAPNYILNWDNIDVADEVTKEGRSVLLKLLKKAEELGYNVMVADSMDSDGQFHKDGKIVTFDEMKNK